MTPLPVAQSSRLPRPDGHGRVRRVGIGLFFGSVAVNALLGIGALIHGNLGETGGKALGTSLTVTGGTLVALACLPAWERRRLGRVPVVGALSSLVGSALVIAAIWSGGDSDVLGKTLGTVVTAALACALACLLALPTLVDRFRPVLTVALALDAIVAAMVVYLMWVEPGSGYVRAMGVVSVLLAASVVSIPVLSRIGRLERAERTGSSFCPFCGEPLAAELGDGPATCGSCGRSFTVAAL